MYTIREVCAKLGLAYITVWQWVRKGKIKAVRVGDSKKPRIRIPESELKRIVREM
jgi:excisionase family DNA binding protein